MVGNLCSIMKYKKIGIIAIAKEEAKRKAARNQIAKDKSTVKKIVEKKF